MEQLHFVPHFCHAGGLWNLIRVPPKKFCTLQVMLALCVKVLDEDSGTIYTKQARAPWTCTSSTAEYTFL